MAYQALLFCPEEKTARTVTQVLAELEFSVDPCSEPFAAVKKLMSQHFDAIVVDCDNEQNATLLFKSARNSTSNQASLAVAIVEGQAGVAKAFRIGANLVLTKPINVEQSKGTLRVARGLLRKGEPGKPAAAAAATPATPVPTTPKPLATKPMPAAKPAAPAVSGVRSAPTPRPAAIPPAPSTIPTAAAKAAPAADIAAVAPTGPASPAAPNAPSLHTTPSAVSSRPSFGTMSAASAPAPAREPEVAVPSTDAPQFEAKIPDAPKPGDSRTSAVEAAQPVVSSQEMAAPTFTFGGANTAEPSSGAGKKVVLGLVAAIVIAAAAYAGWTHFQGPSSPATAKATPTAITPKPQPAAQSASQTVTPSQPQAVTPAHKPDATVADDSHASGAAAENEFADAKPEKSAPPSKVSAKPSGTAAKPSAAATSEDAPSADVDAPAPLVVKGGSQPHHHAASAAAEAPAPSMIGMATPASDAPISGIVADQPTAKPVLQQMKVSQGVAQGLIIKRVAPEYPRNAMTMRIEGAVELVATISKDGDIKDVKVLKGDSQLSRAAVQAVKQWKYKPYLLNGEPVEIQTQITIDFKLPQ